MTFTFLHCADLHLGSPMSGLSLKDEAIARRFSAASREAFSDLVTKAIDERVAFVLIAGDLYDGDWPDNSIGLFFNREAARLARAGIPIFLIKGNHDAASIVTKTIPLPENVIQFSTRAAETHVIDNLRVAIHGRSFPDRAVNENWALEYPRAKHGWFNIGLLHTSCEGNAQHAPYAPCSIQDLVSRGYDYWALGHVHAFDILCQDPWIVFPGNLQGRSVRETGEKGAVFVDVEDGRVRDVRRVIVDHARWVEAIIDVSTAANSSEVASLVGATLRPMLEGAGGRLVAARVRLTGATILDHALRAGRAQLADDTLAIAQHAHEDVWIEKFSIETSAHPAPPGVDLVDIDLDAMLAECARDPELRARVGEEIAQIVARLPADAKTNEKALGGELDALIEDARAIVLARAESGSARR